MTDDVDLFAPQLFDDRLHPRATLSDDGAYGVEAGNPRENRELGAASGISREADDFDTLAEELRARSALEPDGGKARPS